MGKIIKKYAHDYRDMKMSEEEIEKMLDSFLNEIKSFQLKEKLLKYCDICNRYRKVSIYKVSVYNGFVKPLLFSCEYCANMIRSKNK